MCVCAHSSRLHRDGQCLSVNRCGCTEFQPDDGTDGIDDDSCLGKSSGPVSVE